MHRRVEILSILPEAALSEDVRLELATDHDVIAVASLEDGLAHLDGDAGVDLVILTEASDEGTAVARAAALRRARAHMPILVLAVDPENREIRAALHGKQITDSVSVPWRRGELSRAVERAHEIGRLRRDLEAQRKEMHRRIEDLGAMNELTAFIADADSYSALARVLASGLFRGVPEGIGAAILAVDDNAVLHLHCHQPSRRAALQTARDRCVELLASVIGRTLGEDRLSVDITGERLILDGDEGTAGIFTHVPIYVDHKIAGVIVAETATPLSPAAEKQMYFLASRAAETMRRLSVRRDDERRRLGLMVEAMADGLVFTDTSTDHALINPSARRMLGIAADERLTHAAIRQKLGFHPRELLGIRSGGASEVIREEVVVDERSLHCIISPVRDRGGKLVGVVVVLRDNTEAKDLAQRQSQFVSLVSHELRTPLTSISGVIDILASEVPGAMTSRQKRYLQMARDSCNALSSIVDNILDVARSDDGHMSIHFRPLDLDDLSRDVVKRFRQQAQARNIELEVTSEQRAIRIIGDIGQLSQVLSNLLSNAIKFAPEGGQIEVDVFGSSSVEGQVGVSVFNTGEPIPIEARERVFAKFEQLDDVSTRRVGGAGLGLSISRSIIEAHDGRIWAESLRNGTRFVFTLPVAPHIEDTGDDETSEGTAGPRVAAKASHTAPGGAVVLLVDDDRHSSYILKGVLMAAGYQVLTAEEADSALSQARKERPALAVLSTSVTEGEGTDLLQIFTHDPDMRKTAVLVVSSSERDRGAATRAGAEEVLPKPVHPAEFLETCTRLIQEAGRIDSHRIMIVDDDPTIRVVCRDILENAGYAARDVADGPTALEEAKLFRPDLLLLDIMMPKMDGFRTAELFRANPATSMTPIIFVSAKGETKDKVRAFRAGAEDYVVKPFDPPELVARVAKSLERRARELGASPTTQLPGADAIESEIEVRLHERGNHAFCYLDLDNLKAFNDYYGYAKADGVIRQIGDIIRSIVAREGRPGDFIGHIAGDDFVFITGIEQVTNVCTTICDTFDRLIPLYYDKADRELGHIEAKDRYGVMRQFPLMTVSVAAVTVEDDTIATYADLAAAAAVGKKSAKELSGSSYVLNGEVILGQRGGVEDATDTSSDG